MLKASRVTSPNAPCIEIVPYNPDWPDMFAEKSANIKETLGDNCITVHHIGSTSVPGLAAKPIIDMIPVVKDITKVDPASLERLGYTSRGEYGMLFRRFFSKPDAHVHVWEEGNDEIKKHLIFKNYLMNNPEELKRYENLKLDLVKVHANDRASYTLSKDDLVREMLQKAGFDGLTMVQALTDREWGAVRSMRNSYFFDKINIQDPYTWTFDDERHFHLVLSKGGQPIGYDHIQFWPDQRAALRIIVIEEAHRKQGFGKKIMNDIERWLAQQNITSFHTQASPEAYSFYKHLGYIEMPFNDPDGYESDPNDVDMGKVL
jgi:GrpB-like predicted nucleotidyltransferase (UPF0157 family)